ncbi:MAG: DUF6502 family protein [Pseudomonadota bacterium]
MPEPTPDPLLRVLRGLVRPLVRMLISRGVTAPAFYRLLKQVYVEVAHEEFRIDDAPPTDSRITLLTGVHRRDVRAILEADDEPWEETRGKAALFATVLGQWLARNDYTDEDGQPKSLPRSGAPGADFESLVREVNTDIRPRTVLDELIRQGAVAEGPDGLLRIDQAALTGAGADQTKIAFFAANVGDHLNAAAANLMAEPAPFLERAVFYNRLTPEAVDQIEARARDLAQKALEDVNRDGAALQAAEKEAAERGEATGRERFRFGLYFYRETAPEAPEGDETRKGR